MSLPESVKIGPLDPDKAEAFGQVNAASSARQLIRQHNAMYPPDLRKALSAKPNEDRSGDAIDREELFDLVGDDLPDGARITGANVRGEDDATQWITYTWEVPTDEGGSGRSGKGAAVYSEEHFPQSYKAGEERKRIRKAREDGLPWVPSSFAEALSGGNAQPVEDDPAYIEVVEENDDLRKQLDELRERVDELTAQASTPAQDAAAAGTPAAPVEGADGGDAGADPTKTPPWDGYDDLTADQVATRLKDAPEGERVPQAERVSVYERANANRATVTKAVDRILDRTPA